MNAPPPRRLTRHQIALMIGIDVVALLIGVGLFLWLQPRDGQAAVMALVSALVFGGFFNVVVALVSIRP